MNTQQVRFPQAVLRGAKSCETNQHKAGSSAPHPSCCSWVYPNRWSLWHHNTQWHSQRHEQFVANLERIHCASNILRKSSNLKHHDATRCTTAQWGAQGHLHLLTPCQLQLQARELFTSHWPLLDQIHRAREIWGHLQCQTLQSVLRCNKSYLKSKLIKYKSIL